MATAKQRAWRKEFARRFGRKRKNRLRGVRYMARRRRSYRRSSWGISGMFKPVLAGVAGAYLLPKVLPVNGDIAGAGTGFLATRNFKGAVLGWAGAKFVTPMLFSLAGGGSVPISIPKNVGGW